MIRALPALVALASVVQVAPQQTAPRSPLWESLRIHALQARVLAGDQGAQEAFWESVDKTPLIEPIAGDPSHRLVTFLWRGGPDTKNVVVMSELGGYQDFHANQMLKVQNTDVFYRTYRVRSDARFTYFLSPNDPLTPLTMEPRLVAERIGAWKMDPLNPKQTVVPGRMASAVELPDAPPQPYVERREGVPRGKVELQRFKSDVLKNDRQVSVYLPPGYSRNAEPYPVLVLLDGIFYTWLIPVPTILDNMVADEAVRPIVAVVIDTLFARDRELSCDAGFATMLVDELLPWIRSRYHVTRNAADVGIGGASLGGLAAACAALGRSNSFGAVISQSGSFWWAHEGTPHEWVRRRVHAMEAKPVRFYMDVGLMETGPVPGDGPTVLEANRALRDALRAKGYALTYQEFNGGHEFFNWRGTFSDAIRAIYSPRERSADRRQHP